MGRPPLHPFRPAPTVSLNPLSHVYDPALFTLQSSALIPINKSATRASPAPRPAPPHPLPNTAHQLRRYTSPRQVSWGSFSGESQSASSPPAHNSWAWVEGTPRGRAPACGSECGRADARESCVWAAGTGVTACVFPDGWSTLNLNS